MNYTRLFSDGVGRPEPEHQGMRDEAFLGCIYNSDTSSNAEEGKQRVGGSDD